LCPAWYPHVRTHSWKARRRARDTIAKRGLSYSSAQNFRQCPRRWCEKYVKGPFSEWGDRATIDKADHAVLEKRNPIIIGNSAIVGIAVHSVLKELMGFNPSYRTPELLNRLAWDAVHSRAKEKGGYTLEKSQRFHDAIWEKLKAYLQLVDPATVRPVAVEMSFAVTLRGTKIRGVIDLVETVEDPDKGSYPRITDYKSGKLRSGLSAKESKQQVALYAAVYGQETGTLPKETSLVYLGDPPGVTTDTVTVDRVVGTVVTHTRTEEGILDGLERDDFPAKPSALCHWCPFLPECEEGLESDRKHCGGGDAGGV